MAALTGRAPIPGYLGAAEQLIDSALQRAKPLPQGHTVTIPRIVGTEFGGPDTAPLLLLGPSLGTSVATLWSEAAVHLSDKWRVVGWDLPGHGRGEPTDDFTIAELAEGVLALADEFTRETFHYAGDSVGGCVGCNCCWMRRTGWRRPRCCAPVRRSAHRTGGGSERQPSAQAGTETMVAAAAQRWSPPTFMSVSPASAQRFSMRCETRTPAHMPRCVRHWLVSTSSTGCRRSAHRSSRSQAARTSRLRRTICSASPRVSRTGGWSCWTALGISRPPRPRFVSQR